MSSRSEGDFVVMIAEGRCRYLLYSLLGLLLLYPALEQGPGALTLMLVVNSATLLAGVYAVSDTRRHVAIAASLAVSQVTLTLVARFLGLEHPAIRPVAIAAVVVFIAFYVFTLVHVLRYVLRGVQITKDKLFGAVSVYLLMGLAWASVYALVQAVEPGSFASNVADSSDSPDLIYFSFVTLTTLGYGDITPVTARARSLALLEAVTGVLYLAVLVARLVSAYRYGVDPDP